MTPDSSGSALTRLAAHFTLLPLVVKWDKEYMDVKMRRDPSEAGNSLTVKFTIKNTLMYSRGILSALHWTQLVIQNQNRNMPLISSPVFYCYNVCSVNHMSICIQDKALSDSAIQWAMFLSRGRKVRGLDFPSSSYLLVGQQQRAGGISCFLDRALNMKYYEI